MGSVSDLYGGDDALKAKPKAVRAPQQGAATLPGAAPPVAPQLSPLYGAGLDAKPKAATQAAAGPGQKMTAPEVGWSAKDEIGAGVTPGGGSAYKAIKKAMIMHENPGADPQAVSDSIDQAEAQFSKTNPIASKVVRGGSTAATLMLPIGLGAKLAGKAIPAAAEALGPTAGAAARWAMGQGAKTGANVASRVGSAVAGGTAVAQGANVAGNLYSDPFNPNPARNWNSPLTVGAGLLPGAATAGGEALTTVAPKAIPAVQDILRAAAKKVGFNVAGEHPGVGLPPGGAAQAYKGAQARGYGASADEVDNAYHASLKRILGPAAEADAGPRITGNTIAAVQAAEGAKLQDIASRTTINMERAPKMGQAFHDADQMLNPVDPQTGAPGVSLITNPQELALARQHMSKIDSMTQQRQVPDGMGGTRPQWQLDGRDAFELSKTGSQVEKWARQDGPLGDWARTVRKGLRDGVKESIADPAEATRFQEASERYKLAHDLEGPVSRGKVGSLTPQQADAAIERNFEGAGPDTSDSPQADLPLNKARILSKAAVQSRPSSASVNPAEGNVAGGIGALGSMLMSGEPLTGAVAGGVLGKTLNAGKSALSSHLRDTNAAAARLMGPEAGLSTPGTLPASLPQLNHLPPYSGNPLTDVLAMKKSVPNPLLGASQPAPEPWAPPPLQKQEDQ